MNIANNTQTSFYGLKKNIEIGRKVLSEINNEFNRPMHSHTMVDAKILAHQDDPKFSKVVEKLKTLSQKQMAEHAEILAQRKYSSTGSLDETITRVYEDTKKYGYADCNERALVTYEKLSKKGLPAFNLNMIVENANQNGSNSAPIKNHIFSIFDVKKGAKISDPKTWGNNAVVVDWWSNTVMGFKDAEEYFKKVLNFNPEKEKISYKFFLDV